MRLCLFLSYWLSEFLLSAFANRFELRCEPKQLMLFILQNMPLFVRDRELSDVLQKSNEFKSLFPNSSTMRASTFLYNKRALQLHGNKA